MTEDSNNNLPPATPIMALARFEEILLEHQQMSACIDILCKIVDVRVKKDRLNNLIHHVRQADAAFQLVPEMKAWFRGIELQHPETKDLVRSALAEIENFDAGLANRPLGG